MTNARGFIVVTSSIAIKFENLSGQLLHHCRQTDGRSGTYSLGVVAFVPQTMNTIDRELQPSTTGGQEVRDLPRLSIFLVPYPHNVYSVSRKSNPLKTLCNIFSQAESIFGKFCQFVANLYPLLSTNFV